MFYSLLELSISFLQSTQLHHQVLPHTGYSKKLEGYKGLVKIREKKIEDLEDNVRELDGDLERSRFSHASTDVALHQSGVEDRQIFEENQGLMCDGINKGEEIK